MASQEECPGCAYWKSLEREDQSSASLWSAHQQIIGIRQRFDYLHEVMKGLYSATADEDRTAEERLAQITEMLDYYIFGEGGGMGG